MEMPDGKMQLRNNGTTRVVSGERGEVLAQTQGAPESGSEEIQDRKKRGPEDRGRAGKPQKRSCSCENDIRQSKWDAMP